MLNSKTSAHYANIASYYNQSFFNEDGSEYQKRLLDCVLDHLCLKTSDDVVDLGAGTGVFSSALYTKAGLSKNILAVDASRDMLDYAQTLPGLTTFNNDAVSFALDHSIRYDKILIKEMIHHISLSDLPQLYGGIYEQLRQGGIYLTIRRPSIADHMFFQAALELLSKQKTKEDPSIENMERVGFSVSSQTHYYPIKIAKTRWFEMIRNRFWSNFSHFSDDELEQGIVELDIKNAETDILSFEEALVFLKAIKN